MLLISFKEYVHDHFVPFKIGADENGVRRGAGQEESQRGGGEFRTHDLLPLDRLSSN